KIADAKNVGLATSTYFIALDFGLGVGSYILGVLVPTFGYGGLYSSMVVLVALGLLVYYMVYGRYESKKTENMKKAPRNWELLCYQPISSSGRKAGMREPSCSSSMNCLVSSSWKSSATLCSVSSSVSSLLEAMILT